MKQLRASIEETTTYMMVLDSGKAGLQYTTGETLAVFPENSAAVVETLAKAQHWDLDTKFVLKSRPGSGLIHPFPGPMTIRLALTRFCDLTGLPS